MPVLRGIATPRLCVAVRWVQVRPPTDSLTGTAIGSVEKRDVFLGTTMGRSESKHQLADDLIS